MPVHLPKAGELQRWGTIWRPSCSCVLLLQRLVQVDRHRRLQYHASLAQLRLQCRWHESEPQGRFTPRFQAQTLVQCSDGSICMATTAMLWQNIRRRGDSVGPWPLVSSGKDPYQGVGRNLLASHDGRCIEPSWIQRWQVGALSISTFPAVMHGSHANWPAQAC
jgi:hypothetical protein